MIGKAVPIEHSDLFGCVMRGHLSHSWPGKQLSFERESEAYYDSCVISNLPSITIDNGKLSDEL